MKTTTRMLRLIFGLTLLMALTLPFSAPPNASELEDGRRLEDDCLPKDPPPPVVKIKVRVPACSEPGRLIEYRICVENCSTSEAHHVVVKDALPSNAKFVKADPEPSKKGAELEWNLGTVGGGAVREIILTVQPTNREDVKNCARVQFEHGLCVVTRLSARGPGDRPPVISTVPDADRPVFDLTVVGPKEPQYAKQATTYEITLTNKGKTTARNAEIKALLPEKLKFVRATAPGVAYPDNLVEWRKIDLEPGATRKFQLTLQATEKGEFCFSVSAEADATDKKEARICTQFTTASSMSLEMYGQDGTMFVGGKTSYPVIISNRGSVPLTNIRVTAFVPDALKLDKTNPPLLEKQTAAKGGELIEFKSLPSLEAGAKARYEIFVEAFKAGVTRFHIEVRADELDNGPVIEQEITNIVDDGGQK